MSDKFPCVLIKEIWWSAPLPFLPVYIVKCLPGMINSVNFVKGAQ